MQNPDGPSETRQSILVVDDDVNVRLVLRTVLEECGYDVLEAADGNAAFEHVQRYRTDLVITDLIMPGAEGLETIRKLIAFAPGLKIVAMSGAPERVFLRMATLFGAAKTLSKPFNCDAVVRLVRGLLAPAAKSSIEAGGIVR
jgi:CheY-like chemotaxis protein